MAAIGLAFALSACSVLPPTPSPSQSPPGPPDTTPPTLTGVTVQINADLPNQVISRDGEVTSEPSVRSDRPSYTFTSDEAGTIVYAGDCTSSRSRAAAGFNTLTFASLTAG